MVQAEILGLEKFRQSKHLINRIKLKRQTSNTPNGHGVNNNVINNIQPIKNANTELNINI